MKIEFDLEPLLEAAGQLPAWPVALAAVHVWYAAAGLIVKRIARNNPRYFLHKDMADGPCCPVGMWVASPVVLPVYYAWPVAQAALWASSLGLVPPPWKARGKAV